MFVILAMIILSYVRSYVLSHIHSKAIGKYVASHLLACVCVHTFLVIVNIFLVLSPPNSRKPSHNTVKMETQFLPIRCICRFLLA